MKPLSHNSNLVPFRVSFPFLTEAKRKGNIVVGPSSLSFPGTLLPNQWDNVVISLSN